MEELKSHFCLSVSGGEGVHVGEDEVASAVVVEGGLVFFGHAFIAPMLATRPSGLLAGGVDAACGIGVKHGRLFVIPNS